MRGPAGFLMVAVLGSVTGCAHRPVDLAGCELHLSTLTIPKPDSPVQVRSHGSPTGQPGAMTERAEPDLATQFAAALRRKRPGPPAGFVEPASRPPAGAHVLYLSGGGPDGAFGAGFLDAWKASGAFPEFDVVTGISTGALIGPMAFVGETGRAVQGYSIASESELLDVQARSVIDAARKGAIGTLVPLRKRIDRLLDSVVDGPDDDALIGRIAARGQTGALLLIGMVDSASGEAEVANLTAMARDWQGVPAGPDQARRRFEVKQCFIEAMIASSSAPLAAPPVYVNGRQYVDGGARFGVFRRFGGDMTRAAPGTSSYTILNGSWDMQPECLHERPKGATDDAACDTTAPLKDWNLLSVAQRSVAVLTNQVYRFSVAEAMRGSERSLFAAIDRDAAAAHLFDGASCAAARRADRQTKPQPMQFHPREMRCLIDYGRAEATRLQWWNASARSSESLTR